MKPHSIKFLIQEHGVNYHAWWTITRDFSISKLIAKYLGRPFPNQIIFMENGNGHWATDLNVWNSAGKKLLRQTLAGTFPLKELVTDHYKVGQKVVKLCEKIENSNLKKINNQTFHDWLKSLYDSYATLNSVGFVVVVSDLEHNLFSNALKDILINKKVNGENLQPYLNLLMTNDQPNLVFKEQTELIRLAIKYKNTQKLKTSPDFLKHVKKYAWANYGFTGPAFGAKDFLKSIKKIKKLQPNLKLALHSHLNELKIITKQRRRLEKQLGLTKKEIAIFRQARIFSALKTYRVEVRHYFCFVTDLIYTQLEKRLSVPRKFFLYARQDEILDLLKGKAANQKLILKQERFLSEVWNKNRVKYLSKIQLKTLLNRVLIREKIAKTDSVFGQAAFLGKTTGRAKIVFGPKDINKVKKGDILIAIYTDPNLLPAMEKAAAFVTDQGGITSHAAITAREMKKPCIIGTKIATKIFKDGDMVEVNANNGTVKKLS